MHVIIDLAIFPMGSPGQGLSQYVARVLKVIRASGLPHQLTPMGTCIEGEWGQVMRVVDDCYQELEPDSDRIYITFKADCRKGRAKGMNGKIRSVEAKLD